jgi:hypothetical protein
MARPRSRWSRSLSYGGSSLPAGRAGSDEKVLGLRKFLVLVGLVGWGGDGAAGGGLAPVLAGVDGAGGSYARGDGDAGYGEADELALAAAEAADGIAHERELEEVGCAEGGSAEGLTGAELAAEGYAARDGRVREDVVVIGGVGTLPCAIFVS